MSLVADSVEVILPIIYGVLFFNAYHHWNRYNSGERKDMDTNIIIRSIRSLSLGSLQLFQEIDGQLYNRVAKQYTEEQERPVKPAPVRIPEKKLIVTKVRNNIQRRR